MPSRPRLLPLLAVAAAAVLALAAAWWLLREATDRSGPATIRVATAEHASGDATTPVPPAPAPPETAAPSPERRAQVEAMRPRKGPNAVIGRVLDAETGRPVPAFVVDVLPHASADPLARVAADLERRGRAVHDARGLFEWEADPGHWDVVVRSSGYEPAVLVDHVLPALDARPIPLRLVPRPGIAGTLRDELGRPVRDATLFLEVEFVSGDRRPTRTLATSDESGRFKFVDLPPGTYAVTPLESDNRVDRVRGVQVADHGFTPLDITLAPRARVVIHVEGPVGQPLGGSVVELLPSAPGGSRHDGRTGTDGRAVFELVLPGAYELRVTRPGFQPVDEALEVLDGAGRMEQWVRLERTAGG